jgi:endonuclease YncB( thermonuclease family)
MRQALAKLRASITGALLLCAPLYALPACALNCPSDHIDETVRVASVTDGDTLRLSDDRRVRIIGINAPELAHDGRPAEPLAEQATSALQKLVHESDNRVSLRLGEETHDHYGRLLAYVFLVNGESIEAQILSAGFATRVVIPPNVWGQACFANAEDEARKAGRGVWALPAYRTPIDARDLPTDFSGYILLQGRVAHVGGSRHAQWIDLDGGVALKIDYDLLPYFQGFDLEKIRGHRVEARGWLTRPGNKDPRIRLTDPSMLRVLD